MPDVLDLPNRIPAEPIIAVVEAYLAATGDRIGNGVNERASVFALAARADINQNTLEKILNGHTQTIDFNLADRLLCAANMNDLWWTDLRELYDKAQLVEGVHQHKAGSVSGSKICARRGCSVQFVPHVKVPYQKYCSKTCRAAAWKHEHRPLKTGMIRGKGHALTALVCLNGHERTKENTGRSCTGTRDCLVCRKERADRYRKKRRAKKLRQERQARYRQRQREKKLALA